VRFSNTSERVFLSSSFTAFVEGKTGSRSTKRCGYLYMCRLLHCSCFLSFSTSDCNKRPLGTEHRCVCVCVCVHGTSRSSRLRRNSKPTFLNVTRCAVVAPVLGVPAPRPLHCSSAALLCGLSSSRRKSRCLVRWGWCRTTRCWH
jgi:hypothetical protein